MILVNIAASPPALSKSLVLWKRVQSMHQQYLSFITFIADSYSLVNVQTFYRFLIRPSVIRQWIVPNKLLA